MTRLGSSKEARVEEVVEAGLLVTTKVLCKKKTMRMQRLEPTSMRLQETTMR